MENVWTIEDGAEMTGHDIDFVDWMKLAVLLILAILLMLALWA
jgi:uncharacterized membrane protein YqiK